MEPNEYEKQWAEGEENPGLITDAIAKARRKQAVPEPTDAEKEFAAAYDEQPDVAPKSATEKDKA